MAIDKAKGIVCKPMPRSWHDRHTVFKIQDDDTRDLYKKIVADKKPYFMRYIYPALMKEYNSYISNTNKKALREFQMTVDELNSLSGKDLTDRQDDFLHHYRKLMPVGVGDCVMNKICRRFEDAFDCYISKHNSSGKFDYTILKSSAEYTHRQYYEVEHLYDEYNKRLKAYAIFSSFERIDEWDSALELNAINEDFKQKCAMACPDRFALCNIVLDICYRKNSTKRFAWNMCGEEIIENLLNNNGRTISYPALAEEDGDIEYCGNRFRVESIKVEDMSDDSAE